MHILFIKPINIIIASLLFIFILNTESFSSHLKDKSKKEKEKYLEIRISKIPSDFSKIIIPPGKNKKNIIKNIVENKNTDKIDENIKNSTLLSVLYYDGKKITVDKKSNKINDDTKLYSMSISKSFVSYILGEAICSNHIKSINDKISIYVPEAKGTLYENSTLKDLINMSAGDTSFSNRQPGSATFSYVNKVIVNKDAIKEYLALSTGKKITTKEFNYHNFLTDLIARAIDVTVPGGLKESYHAFASKAGTNSEMFLLTDKNGWPLLHGWFYATREDFLRLGIQVAEDWNSKTCIGDYLTSIEKMKIKAPYNSSYSGFFWYSNNIQPRHTEMRGHGGQRIHINLKKGSVLAFHSIANDYNEKHILDLIK